MRDCTYTLSLKNPINDKTEYVFNTEAALESFIKDNMDYFSTISNSDYKFSKNIQGDLVTNLDAIHKQAYDQLYLDRQKARKDFEEAKKKAKQRTSEEEIPQYSDGFISVLDLIGGGLDSKTPFVSPFSLSDWRRVQGNKIREANANKNYTDDELDAIVREALEREESSWDYLQDIGRGLHLVLDKVFGSSKRRNSDYLASLVQKTIQDSNRNDLSLRGIKTSTLKSYINSLYDLKSYIEDSSGKNVVKYYPEFVIDYQDESLKLRGKIDLLVVYDDGSVDVIDLKVSTKNQQYWDADKKQTINYQLGFYKRMLEAKGITGKINTKIIPVQAVGYNKDAGSIERFEFDNISFTSPTISQSDEINALLYADPKLQTIDTPIASNTIEALSKMFTVGTMTDSFNAANVEYLADRYIRTSATGFTFNDYARINNGKPIEAATREELMEKIADYQLAVQRENSKFTGSIQSNLGEVLRFFNKNPSKNYQARDLTVLPLNYGPGLNAKFALNLAKYKNEIGWEVIENEDLLQLNVIMLQNQITKQYDLVSISPDDLTAKIDLKLGSSILGNFYNNSQVERNKNILESTIGNIELMKLLHISNIVNPGDGYTIGDLKVINPRFAQEHSFLYDDKLVSNYTTLAKKIGIPQLKVQFSDPYLKTLRLYTNIMEYSQNIPDFRRSKITVELDDSAHTAEAKLEQLVKLYNEIKNNFFSNKSVDQDTSLIADLYRSVAKSIDRLSGLGVDYYNYKELPAYFSSSIVQSFKEGTFANGTYLNTIDTIPVLGEISSRIFQTNSRINLEYKRYKDSDRTVINNFYKNLGNPLTTNNIVNNYTGVFTDLLDKSEDGQKRFLTKDPYRDNSLTSQQKDFLIYWLNDLNRYRYPGQTVDELEDRSKWFEIPLLRGSTMSRITNGENALVAWKENAGLELVDPKMSIGVVNNNTEANNELTAMYNTFEISESDDSRLKMLKEAGKSPELVYETNFEHIKDMYVFSKIKKREFDKVLPIIDSAVTSLSASAFISNKNVRPVVDFIRDYIRTAVLDQSLIKDGKDVFKAISAARSLTSKMILGGNLISGAKETVVGFHTLYNNAVANTLFDKDRVNLAQMIQAYAMTWGDAATQIANITLGEHLNHVYRMANVDMNAVVERMNYEKLDTFRLNDRLFWTSRAPDYLHRMTLLRAYMIKYDCLNAHEISGNTVKYNWRKDGRFSAYAAGRTSDPQYNFQRALYETMMQEFIAGGYTIQDADGNTRALTLEDDLPQAFTERENEKIKQEAESLFGYMDHDTKSLYLKTGIGLVIGQFQTFFSAKKNQYFLTRGTYKNGKWAHMKDLDGNLQYWKKTLNDDGTVTRELTTEITDSPFVDWQGSMIEGIFWSLRDLFNVTNMTALREAWKDPVKKRNLAIFMGDLFALTLLYALIDFLFGEKSLDELTWAERNVKTILNSTSNEINIYEVFSGQMEFNFTSFEALKRFGETGWSVAKGDVHFARIFTNNLGIVRPFKYELNQAFQVE